MLGITPISNAYPLITGRPNTGELTEVSVELVSDVSVAIVHQPEANAIAEVLCRAEEGQQVLWIENTVNEAQVVYKYLAARASEIGGRAACCIRALPRLIVPPKKKPG